MLQFWSAEVDGPLSSYICHLQSKGVGIHTPVHYVASKIVPYDTYIIFEQNLGAMLFTRFFSKNINTF